MITFRDNANRYKAHRDRSRSKGQKDPGAADYKNAVDDPLLQGDDDEETLDRIPPPELHLHEGIVNKLVTILNEKWIEDSDVRASVFGYLGGLKFSFFKQEFSRYF